MPRGRHRRRLRRTRQPGARGSRSVKRHGGKVTSTVSGKTTYLLVGMDCGKSKYNKAKQHGTTLIDEDACSPWWRRAGRSGGREIKPEPAQRPPPRSPRCPRPSPPPSPPPRRPPRRRRPSRRPRARTRPHSGSTSTTPINPLSSSATAKIAELRKLLTTREDVHLKGPEIKGKDKPMKSVLISGAPGVGKSSARRSSRSSSALRLWRSTPDTRGASGKDVKEGVGGKASNAIREMVTNRAVASSPGSPRRCA